MKKLFCLLVFMCALFGCSDSGKNVDRQPSLSGIKARGILQAGVKADAPRMSFLNPETNEFEGLEVDLARELAKHLLGDARKVRFKPVTPQNRVDKLNLNAVDLLIATFTVMEDRKKAVLFSEPYFDDGMTFLVRKRDHLNRIRLLDEKKVAVAQNTAPLWLLPAESKKRGLRIKIEEYPDYPIIVGALKRGEVDAFCSSRSALFGYSDDTLEIMDDMFNPVSFAVAVKNGNRELLEIVNAIVTEMKENGTLDKLKAKWGF